MNNEITVLRGPDRIRKRPAVVFTDDGIVGTTNAVKSLLRIFVGEAALGKCSKISFFENQDGSFTVESFDKGFALGEKTVEGKPLWYYDFCEFLSPTKIPMTNSYLTPTPPLYTARMRKFIKALRVTLFLISPAFSLQPNFLM